MRDNTPLRITPEMQARELADVQLAMQVLQEVRPKVRKHRREVHTYKDHTSTIEEIVEEY